MKEIDKLYNNYKGNNIDNNNNIDNSIIEDDSIINNNDTISVSYNIIEEEEEEENYNKNYNKDDSITTKYSKKAKRKNNNKNNNSDIFASVLENTKKRKINNTTATTTTTTTSIHSNNIRHKRDNNLLPYEECDRILQILQESSFPTRPYREFKAPNNKLMSLPGYSTVVKRAMNFQLLVSQIRKYKSYPIFSRDVNLIFDNCLAYYTEESMSISNMRIAAMTLKQAFQSLEAEYKTSHPYYQTEVTNESELLNILEKLKEVQYTYKACIPFMCKIPEDWVEYRKKISNPIDLKTIIQRYNDGKYKNFNEFVNQIRLVISNAKTFYKDDIYNKVIYNAAKQLEFDLENELNRYEGRPVYLSRKVEDGIHNPRKKVLFNIYSIVSWMKRLTNDVLILKIVINVIKRYYIIHMYLQKHNFSMYKNIFLLYYRKKSIKLKDLVI